MKRLRAISVLLMIAGTAHAQVLQKEGFKLGGTPSDRPVSNTINDILIHGFDVWVGTSRGLMRTVDQGETWSVFDQTSGLGKGGISALAADENALWVATAFDTTTDQGRLSAGGGLAYTRDDGETWTYIPQPVDDRDETRYKPTTTVVQNLTYDIALTPEAVWIVSFGGGLRRSFDDGETWEVVTVDGAPFDALGRLAHRVFSVLYVCDVLWVGSAAGVHRSLDGGETWTTFDNSQPQGISGNFVVALASQPVGGSTRIWAATIEALGEGERRAVSYTDDMGLSWSVVLEGEFAHNFGHSLRGGTIYVATDNGLFKSMDGQEWALYPPMVDEENDYRVLSQTATAVAADQRYLWVGTDDGLARNRIGGSSWQIYRAYASPGQDGEPETYAYPNPFSPTRHNVLGDDGHVRFQYRCKKDCDVTVRVYDFSMSLVATVAQDKFRQAGDWAETWDGRNDLGERVANGVYFYRIDRTGHATAWGKVMVLD